MADPKEIKIPPSVSGELFVVVQLGEKYDFGEVQVHTFDIEKFYEERIGQEKDRYKTIARQTYTINLVESVFDVRQEMIDTLENAKSRQMAQHEIRMNEINDKLQKLKLVTYQPQKGDMCSAEVEIPF